MKTKFLILILFFSFPILISSCGNGDIYKQYKELPGYKWERIEKGKSVVFDNIEIKKGDIKIMTTDQLDDDLKTLLNKHNGELLVTN